MGAQSRSRLFERLVLRFQLRDHGPVVGRPSPVVSSPAALRRSRPLRDAGQPPRSGRPGSCRQRRTWVGMGRSGLGLRMQRADITASAHRAGSCLAASGLPERQSQHSRIRDLPQRPGPLAQRAEGGYYD
jgi:hypothetical protein